MNEITEPAHHLQFRKEKNHTQTKGKRNFFAKKGSVHKTFNVSLLPHLVNSTLKQAPKDTQRAVLKEKETVVSVYLDLSNTNTRTCTPRIGGGRERSIGILIVVHIANMPV